MVSQEHGGQQFGDYMPEHDAPEEGEFDRSGDVSRWRQAHNALVQDALYSYKGSPSDMHNHMRNHLEGGPTPDSGSGKQMRTQAAALLHELATNARPSPRPLYRGSSRPSTGTLPTGYSERRAVASRFAKANGGEVYTKPKGTTGLRIADYISSGLDQDEKEWLVP